MKWEDALLNQVGMTVVDRHKELHKNEIGLSLLCPWLLGGAGTQATSQYMEFAYVLSIYIMVQLSVFSLLSIPRALILLSGIRCIHLCHQVRSTSKT